MMGEPLGRQDRLFYEFDLEDMVPADHLLRRIDAALDLSWLRGELKAHYIRHNNDSSTLPFGFNCCAIGLGGRVFTQPGPNPDIPGARSNLETGHGRPTFRTRLAFRLKGR